MLWTKSAAHELMLARDTTEHEGLHCDYMESARWAQPKTTHHPVIDVRFGRGRTASGVKLSKQDNKHFCNYFHNSKIKVFPKQTEQASTVWSKTRMLWSFQDIWGIVRDNRKVKAGSNPDEHARYILSKVDNSGSLSAIYER